MSTEINRENGADSLTESTLAGESVQEISLGKRFFNLKTAASFLIAFAILGFMVTKLDIDTSAIWKSIQQSNPLLYALSFVVYYSTFIMRGGRWQVLLENVGFRKAKGINLPSMWGLGQIIFLSWFANCVVPAKLGDAYRAYLLKKDANVGFSKTVGTILAERIIDMVILFVMLAGAALLVIRGSNSGTAVSVMEVGLGFIALLIIGLVGMRLFSGMIQRLIPHRFRPYYDHFLAGTMGSFQRLPRLAIVTIMVWLFEAWRLLLVTQSLGISVALSLVIFVALAHSLLTAIPFTPGGLGLAEAGMVGLLMIAVNKESAISIALLDRVISYWSILAFGGILLVLRWRKRPAPEPDSAGLP